MDAIAINKLNFRYYTMYLHCKSAAGLSGLFFTKILRLKFIVFFDRIKL